MNMSRNTELCWSQGIYWHPFTLNFFSLFSVGAHIIWQKWVFTWVFWLLFFLIKDIIGFLLLCGERLNNPGCLYLQHIILFKLTLQMLGNWGQGMPHRAWKSLLTRHGKVFCTLRPHECKDLSLVGLKVVKVGYLQIRALRFTHRLKKLPPASLTGSCQLRFLGHSLSNMCCVQQRRRASQYKESYPFHS